MHAAVMRCARPQVAVVVVVDFLGAGGQLRFQISALQCERESCWMKGVINDSLFVAHPWSRLLLLSLLGFLSLFSPLSSSSLSLSSWEGEGTENWSKGLKRIALLMVPFPGKKNCIFENSFWSLGNKGLF